MMKIRNTRELAAVVRAHRRKLGWSQAQTAKDAGVSREWLIEFEKAKATVELGMVLRLMRVLGLGIEIAEIASGVDAKGARIPETIGSTPKGGRKS